ELGRAAEEFLVEPVAPPAHRLREHDAGRERVGDGQEAYARPPDGDPDTECAHRDPAPDAEPAVPQVQRGDRVAALAEVALGVGDDVVEPGADEPERHRPDGQVGDEALLAAARDPAPVTDPDRDE